MNGVLSSSSDPGRLRQVEEHVRRVIQSVYLSSSSKSPCDAKKTAVRTNIKTVPFSLGPLQY